jgi:hypothetical protein
MADQTDDSKNAPAGDGKGDDKGVVPNGGDALEVKSVTDYVLPPSGDPAVDIAFKFLAQNGIVPGSAAWEAAQKGEFGLVKAAFAEKGVKGGADYVAILEDKAQKGAAAAKEAREQLTAIVHDAAGGKEAWESIKTWVGDVATEPELKAVNAALKADPFTAKIMVEGLRARHARATGQAEDTTASQVQLPMARGGAGASGVQPLSLAEYRAEAQKLQQQLGVRFESSPEFATLRSRRAAGMAAEGRR